MYYLCMYSKTPSVSIRLNSSVRYHTKTKCEIIRPQQHKHPETSSTRSLPSFHDDPLYCSCGHRQKPCTDLRGFLWCVLRVSCKVASSSSSSVAFFIRCIVSEFIPLSFPVSPKRYARIHSHDTYTLLFPHTFCPLYGLCKKTRSRTRTGTDDRSLSPQAYAHRL